MEVAQSTQSESQVSQELCSSQWESAQCKEAPRLTPVPNTSTEQKIILYLVGLNNFGVLS